MKKFLLLFFLYSLSGLAIADDSDYLKWDSDYLKWGTLDDGGIKAKHNYPKNFASLNGSRKIHPSSYGKQLHFSVYVKPTGVLVRSRLWTHFADDSGILMKGSSKYGERIVGTHAKRIYTLTTQPVPFGAKYIRFSVFLKGAGQIETSNYQLLD